LLTKTKVCPGTPSSCGTSNVEIVWMNMSRMAERIAGRTIRSVIDVNTFHFDAPLASAASSSAESIDENAATPMRNAIGMTWIDCTNTMPCSE
jgi:hypothetical protein